MIVPVVAQQQRTPQQEQELTWRTLKALAFLPPPPELDTDSPTPNMSVESQIREATVVFVKFDGPRIVAALNSTGNSSNSDTLDFMMQLMTCAQQSTRLHEAMLRQFLVDDKGMVMIFALGVPRCQHMDDPLRGLHTAHHFCKGLAEIGVIAFAGVTTGRVYVGTVGNRQRKEYVLVGDTVNLSARLMAYGFKQNFQGHSEAYCWPKEPAKFCIITEERTMSCGREYFKFELHPSIKIKGMANLDVYELVTSAAPAAAEKRHVGFGAEMRYVTSLFRQKEHRRRVSYLAAKSSISKTQFASKPKPQSASSASASNTNFGISITKLETRRVSLLKQDDLSNEVNFVELSSFKLANREGKIVKKGQHQQHQQHPQSGQHKAARQEEGHGQLPEEGHEQLPEEGHEQLPEAQHDAPGAPGPPHEEQGMANSDLLNASTAAAIARVEENDSDEDEAEPSTEPVASAEELKLLRETAHRTAPCARRTAGKSANQRGGMIVVLRGEEGGGKSTFHKLVTENAGSFGVLCASIKLKQTDLFQPYSTLALIFKTLFEREEVRHFTANPEKAVFEQTMLEWNNMLTPAEQTMLPEVKRTVLKMGSWNIAGWKPSNERRSKDESHEMIREILLKLLLTPTVSKLFNEAVVLVVDNVNFMDSCSWEVLVQVVVVPTTQLLVICTAPAQKTHRKKHAPNAQEGGEAGADAGDAAAHRKLTVFVQKLSASAGEIHSLALGRLSRSETEEAVRQACPSQAFSAEEFETIWNESQGHPNRAIETARSGKVTSPSTSGGGEEAVGAAAGNSDPITKAITARIDSLRIDEQRCLKAASVIGVEFKYETLLEVVPRQYLRLREDKTTLLDTILQDLIKQDLIRCISDTTISGRRDASFEFTHTRLRTTCYSLLLRADQINYHKQVANWIATRYQDDLRKFYVPLMFHFCKANDFDKGVDYAIGAIKQSIESGAFGECKVIIEEVLRFIDSKKLKPRTIRMVYNTITHLLRQHKDTPLEEKMADERGSTGSGGSTDYASYVKSPGSNEDPRTHKVKYMPSPGILLAEGETRSEGSRNDSFQSMHSSIDSAESDKDSELSGMFRHDVTSNARAMGDFWEYLESVALRLARALNPAPAEGNEGMRSTTENDVKATAAGQKLPPPKKASLVCSVM